MTLVSIIMRTVTVKVDDGLRRRMASIAINWSEYIREAIVERIEREDRKKAAQRLVEDLDGKKATVPKGFINQTIRETRKTR